MVYIPLEASCLCYCCGARGQCSSDVQKPSTPEKADGTLQERQMWLQSVADLYWQEISAVKGVVGCAYQQSCSHKNATKRNGYHYYQ